MADRGTTRRSRRESGHAVIEVALLGPWIFFLFVGVLDFGFFAYAAIATQNAARVAALYTSSDKTVANDALGACSGYVIPELRSLPNMATVTTCGALPVIVTAQKLDSTTTPQSADGALSTRVAVTYQSISMIPIPGLMMQQYTLTRIVEMRVRED